MIDLKKIGKELKALIKSPNGHDLLTFGVFLVIATLFWFLMSLNDEVQHDYELKTEITGLPDDMTLINPAPEYINVSVKDKGSNLFSHDFGRRSALTLNYKDFKESGKNKLTLSESQLSASIRAYFGNSGTIISQSPDSIAITYTTNPPVKARLNIVSDIRTSSQHIVFGQLKSNCDTIKIYSSHDDIDTVAFVDTEKIILSNLSDTAQVEVKVIAPVGTRVVPERVKITIPVEPLIAKTRNIPVEIINVPVGFSVLTFPSSVEITYLLPMSRYNVDDFDVKAYADYEKRTDDGRISLMLSILPEYYRSASISPSSVEYVIEKAD